MVGEANILLESIIPATIEVVSEYLRLIFLSSYTNPKSAYELGIQREFLTFVGRFNQVP